MFCLCDKELEQTGLVCAKCGEPLAVLGAAGPSLESSSASAAAAASSNEPVHSRSWSDRFWPPINDEASCRAAARRGAYAAFALSGLTAIFVFISLFQPNTVIEKSAVFESMLAALLGYWILRMSRVAAAVALVYYVLDKVIEFSMHPGAALKGPALALTALLLLALITGVRGTFQFRKMYTRKLVDEAFGLPYPTQS